MEPWDELEACPVADEAVWLQHVAGFVAHFIIPAKRERWQELLTRRPRRVYRNSHKLHSDLEHRTCSRCFKNALAVLQGDGVYYDFRDAARVVPVELVRELRLGEAIFSLIPGMLALYFFHEDEIWLCEASE